MKQIILIADCIKSDLSNPRQLIVDLKEMIDSVNALFQNSLISPFSITWGNEIQGMLKNAMTASQIIIHLEEELIHRKSLFKLRYVLHERDVETVINDKIADELFEERLTEARKILTSLKDEKGRVHVTLVNSVHSELLNKSFKIFESITAKWREKKDEEIVSNFLKYKDYKIIAKILVRERSLIWKRQKSLQLALYYSIKSIIELSFKLSY